jgi:hypothetical protein
MTTATTYCSMRLRFSSINVDNFTTQHKINEPLWPVTNVGAEIRLAGELMRVKHVFSF